MNSAFRASLSFFLLFAVGSILDAQDETKSAALNPSNLFEEKIRPHLMKYCADCHAPGESGDLNFLNAKTESDLAGLRGLYVDVVAQMESHSMPPGDSDQPSNAERKLVTDWIKTKLELRPEDFERIAQYVVEVYEDRKGNLWFGTMHKGAARYDGQTLTWFSKEDGLPSNAVPGFAEDKDGNLWAGTQEGVCKFDGQKFIQFGSAEGLPDRYGRVLADRDGNLWAGMNTGVFRFDGSRFSEFKVPIDKDKISSYAIIPGQVSLALHDKKGNLWFSTDGYGAFKYDGTSFTHFTNKDGLCSNNVTSILEDQQGNIWFTCIQSYQPGMTGDGGVCRYDGTSFTSFPKVKGLSENDIYTIYETKTGNIWIGASGHGAYRYDGTTFTLFSETDRKHWTRNFGLQSMVEDRNGTLWFGFSGGLFRFNGKSFFNVTKDGPWTPADDNAADAQRDPTTHVVAARSKPPRLPEEFAVRSILEDRKGNFWFGSWQSGVARFDGEKLTIFTEADGLDRNQVRDIYEDAQGTIWFNTGDGICSYDPSASLTPGGKEIINHTTDRDYNSKDDWQLGAEDLWFGEDDSRGGNNLEGQPGLYRYDGEKLTFLAFPLPRVRGSDWEYKCTGIARGKDGRIWFATYGSVIGYDGKSFTFMNNQSGSFDGSTETDLHVRSIFEDSRGRLWIGNNGIGVLLHENGKTINFTQKHGLGSQENRRGGPLPGDAPEGSPSLDRVFSIGEDSAGNIWFGLVGKQGYGAWRYDPAAALKPGGKSLRHFTEKDGLTSKGITAIYRDKRGDLWLGGEGVFKFNGKSFDRIH